VIHFLRAGWMRGNGTEHRTQKTTAGFYDQASCQRREGDTVKHPRDAHFERYAGESNLPAKKLDSVGPNIVELLRLGTILSF
jgi:hypothetical protein